MDRTRFVITGVITTLYFITACTTQSEKIVETVIVEITSTPLPTEDPTDATISEPTLKLLLQADKEEVASFTRDIRDLTSECQASDFLYDFSKDGLITGFSSGIHNVREKCDLMEIEIEIPEHCEPCLNVISMVQEHAQIMLNGTDLIEKGHSTLNEDYVSEGLEMFWDADIFWEEIEDAIDGVRTEYNLPVFTR